MWAEDLEGGNSEAGFEHNETHAAFNVSISLTDKGFDHVNEVRVLFII
jgi:secreted Zn-dependent insulinase-like peptidase